MIKFEKGMKNRQGQIITPVNELRFPAFLPDATYGTVSNVSYSDLKLAGVEGIVTNTLHLEQKIGNINFKKLGGFHNFTKWDRPVLTDSGGFQVFSLIYRNNDKGNKITEAGCSFKDYSNGKYLFLSPENSQQIQANIGSDIRVVLDEPLFGNSDLKSIKRSVDRTTIWAKRAKEEFLKINNLTHDDFNDKNVKRPLLTAVIQGGNNFEERRRSFESLHEVGFDIYGLGGLPLQSPRTWDYQHKGGFYKELLHFLSELIPKDKIRYALGVGNPDNMIYAVSVGWDIFDTVLPTRNGRHGYIYVSKGQGDEEFSNYSVLHLKSKQYEFDSGPIDENCNCHTCKTTSRQYLRYLLRIGEGSGYRLASIHNLHFFTLIINKLRSE